MRAEILRTRAPSLCAVAVSAALVAASPVRAEVSGLGAVDFLVSCNAAASSAFEGGLLLLHHMMYRQAEDAFTEAADADPDCAMAHWGIAMSNFHPMWPGVPSEAETSRGQAAIAHAMTLEPGSAREAAYLEAVGAFHDAAEAGYRGQLSAWAEAQRAVQEAWPDDVDAGAFAALARLSTAPGGDPELREQREAGTRLEALHARAPEHPGVVHYAIHAYDHPPLADKGLGFARGYDAIAPSVPHALHMPSHIFVRLGLWEETAEWNRRSAETALAQPLGETVPAHYAHAIDYQVYSHLQTGQVEAAEALLGEFLSHADIQDNFGAAYALSATPARVPLEREDWARAASLPEIPHDAIAWERYPQARANVWFAKGIGAARSGKPEAARTAHEALLALGEEVGSQGGGYWMELIDAQAGTVEAWTTLAEGDPERALELMQRSADFEDRLGKSPVTPGHVLPARELLGDTLMELDQPESAQAAYEASLEQAPKRRRSEQGLERAAAG